MAGYRLEKLSKDLPPPPEKPDPMECCASGCVPCIFDYYYDRLTKWEEANGITIENYLARMKDDNSKFK